MNLAGAALYVMISIVISITPHRYFHHKKSSLKKAANFVDADRDLRETPNRAPAGNIIMLMSIVIGSKNSKHCKSMPALLNLPMH